jgi:hypothetical protein
MKQPLMRQHEFLVLVDGTSRETILAQTAIVEWCARSSPGASAIDLKRGLDSPSAQGSEADWLTTSLYFCG